MTGATKRPAPVQAPPEPPPAPAPAKTALNPRVVAAGGAVVLALLYVFVLKPGPNRPAPLPATAPAALPPESVERTDAGEVPHDGPVMTLDSVTVNLADGRFLRIGVALQLEKAGGGDDVEPASYGARAIDSLISVMSRSRSDDLRADVGLVAVKEELAETIVARYGGEVLGVYLTDFVMQ